MTADEVELAERLEIPIYGSDPELNWLGSKTGSRRVFAEEDVPHPIGLDIACADDLSEALREIAPAGPEARGAVLKLDRGVSGLGNALLDLEQASRDLHAAVELEDEELTVEQYLAALDDEGGIVEERIEGEVFQVPACSCA